MNGDATSDAAVHPGLLPEPAPTAAAAIRRIIGWVAAEQRRLVAGLLFVAISAGAELAYPQLLRIVVDDYLSSGGNTDGIALLLSAMLLLLAVQGFTVFLRNDAFRRLSERLTARLRRQFLDSMLLREIAFFDRSRTGDLMHRLTSDIAHLQQALGLELGLLFRNLVYIFGGFALLLYTSTRLTAYMLVAVAPIALVIAYASRRLRRSSQDAHEAAGLASEFAGEALASMRTIRLFAREPLIRRIYRDRTRQVVHAADRSGSVRSAVEGFSSVSNHLVIVAVAGLGVLAVGGGGMSLGVLITFMLYAEIVATGVERVARYVTDGASSIAAAQRVIPYIDVATADAPACHCPTAVAGRIEFRDVSFSYPSRPGSPVLESFDLTIEPAEVVALVGPSGAGKSTIIGLLTRLFEPRSGAILLDGTDIRQLDPSWLRERIGLVPQDPALFSMSIADNLRFGRMDATDAAVEAAARAALAHDFIASFPAGYDTLCGERGVAMSGGQRQRIAIARAILKDPAILVLDEATSSLDADSEHGVSEALGRLMHGRTTIIIAHRLSTVARADRVIVLDGGRIVQVGRHASLIAEPGLYRRLVERQLQPA